VKPSAIFQLVCRHEKRTGHSLKLLLRDEGIVLKQGSGSLVVGNFLAKRSVKVVVISYLHVQLRTES